MSTTSSVARVHQEGGSQILSNRRWLFERYVLDGMTLREIAPLAGCSHQQVAAALEQHGIPRRPRARRPKSPRLVDGAWLADQYLRQRRTTVELAAELGVTARAVNRALRRHDITLRAPRHHRPAPRGRHA